MQNLSQFKTHDIQQLRLKNLQKNYQWLAEQMGTNKTYISFALTGKHPVLLEKIVLFLDQYEVTNSEILSQVQ